jgi:hypothetical protein
MRHFYFYSAALALIITAIYTTHISHVQSQSPTTGSQQAILTSTSSSATSNNPLSETYIESSLSTYKFQRALYYGRNYKPDTAYLEYILNTDNDTRLLPGKITSTSSQERMSNRQAVLFDGYTRAAVKRFQAKYAKDILAPRKFKNPHGAVDALTRAKLNSLIPEIVVKNKEKKTTKTSSNISTSSPITSQILNTINGVTQSTNQIPLSNRGSSTPSSAASIESVTIGNGQRSVVTSASSTTFKVGSYSYTVQNKPLSNEDLARHAKVTALLESSKQTLASAYDVNTFVIQKSSRSPEITSISTRTATPDTEIVLSGNNFAVAAGDVLYGTLGTFEAASSTDQKTIRFNARQFSGFAKAAQIYAGKTIPVYVRVGTMHGLSKELAVFELTFSSSPASLSQTYPGDAQGVASINGINADSISFGFNNQLIPLIATNPKNSYDAVYSLTPDMIIIGGTPGIPQELIDAYNISGGSARNGLRQTASIDHWEALTGTPRKDFFTGKPQGSPMDTYTARTDASSHIALQNDLSIFLEFGGRLGIYDTCECSGGLLIYMYDVRGYFWFVVFQFPYSQLKGNYNMVTPGVNILGGTTPGGVCLKYAGVTCYTYVVPFGTIDLRGIGTSLGPA